MADILIDVVKVLAALCAGAILVGALLRFSQWAVAATISTAWLAVRAVIGFVIASSCWLAASLQAATIFVLSGTWRAFVAALRIAAVWVLARMAAHSQRFRAALVQWAAKRRERQASAEDADDNEGAARDEPNAEAEDDGQAQADAGLSEYERALELLGLQGAATLTRIDLKRRYAELMSILHPDKGFPNRQFAQQINDAVAIIKRHHNWR